MENKDIKDFQSVSTVSELDNILLVQSTGVNGKMTVALFKTAVRNDVTPSIKENVWWIGTVNTGIVAAGKTPEFRKGDLGIEWKYTTDTAWKLLVNYESISLTFDDLTEAQKDSLKLHFSDLTEADIAELKQPAQDMIAELENTNTSITAAEALRVEAEKKRQTDTAAAIKSATDAAGAANTAAENVEDGKTPSFAIGTVSQGTSASATVTADGTDTAGNPKYKINLVLPQGDKGDTGKTPVLEIGSTTTGNPGTQASATLTANGTTTSGNPKYLLSLTIPRGDKGLPGEGSGNVSASGSGLVSGKKYLFVPAGNNSTEGSFVEYTAPTIPEQVQPDWNAASGKGAILNKPTIPTKVSQLTNDSNYASKTYVDEEIDKIPTPDVSAQIGAHNTSETAHPYIRSLIADYLSTAKGYADEKIAALIGSAPEILDTLGELADAIVNNQEAVTAIDNAISQKLGKTEAQNLYVALQGYVAYSQAEKNKLAGIQANANNFPDAPSDNKQYGRKNGAWSEVVAGAGGGVEYYDINWLLDMYEDGNCTQEQYDGLLDAVQNNKYMGFPTFSMVGDDSIISLSVIIGLAVQNLAGASVIKWVITPSLQVESSSGDILGGRKVDENSSTAAVIYLRTDNFPVAVNPVTLNVSMPESENSADEYIFQFTSGISPTVLTMPAYIKWVNEPVIEANKTYQVSIVNKIAVIGGVE
jgi:hypothetical protein|nr:MAG TPA: FIBRITIN T4, STRUCTURAL PROTEIN, CHAPERONE.85A [Caudoviricetes sp.]